MPLDNVADAEFYAESGKFFPKMPDTTLQTPSLLICLTSYNINLADFSLYLPSYTQHLADSTSQMAAARYFLAVVINKEVTYRLKTAANAKKVADIGLDITNFCIKIRVLISKPTPN
ncbi:MAG: hypothetical protein IPJ74_26525 [Saprospiraceae bacterium]|nr:hypothetical protein [Saprospiraceae bacterium]